MRCKNATCQSKGCSFSKCMQARIGNRFQPILKQSARPSECLAQQEIE